MLVGKAQSGVAVCSDSVLKYDKQVVYSFQLAECERIAIKAIFRSSKGILICMYMPGTCIQLPGQSLGHRHNDDHCRTLNSKSKGLYKMEGGFGRHLLSDAM